MIGRFQVKVEPGRVKEHTLSTYVVRFALGGAITAVVGLIANEFGPVVGGLFLAFPSIAPATFTLIEKRDGARAAGASALGAAFGGLGLLAFAAVVWGFVGRLPAWLVLMLATLAWLGVSISSWAAFHQLRHGRKPLRPTVREALGRALGPDDRYSATSRSPSLK